jgi:hypothetical protein
LLPSVINPLELTSIASKALAFIISLFTFSLKLLSTTLALGFFLSP